MIRLGKALDVWGTPAFATMLKQEIEQLGVEQLPLQHGLSAGNYVLDEPIMVTILNVAELEQVIRVKAGIFFRSVIGGCSCADDPTPIDKIEEYCEVQLDIDKVSTVTTIALVAD